MGILIIFQKSKLQPQRGVDLACGVGFVQGVEMDACKGVVEQLGGLLGSVVDACAFNSSRVIIVCLSAFDPALRQSPSGSAPLESVRRHSVLPSPSPSPFPFPFPPPSDPGNAYFRSLP